MDGASVNAASFLTPPRILIPKLATSRDGWKRKAGDRKRRLKAARIRIRDLEASRERWHERADAAERRTAESQRQLEQAQAERTAAVAEADRLRDELKKK